MKKTVSRALILLFFGYLLVLVFARNYVENYSQYKYDVFHDENFIVVDVIAKKKIYGFDSPELKNLAKINNENYSISKNDKLIDYKVFSKDAFEINVSGINIYFNRKDFKIVKENNVSAISATLSVFKRYSFDYIEKMYRDFQHGDIKKEDIFSLLISANRISYWIFFILVITYANLFKFLFLDDPNSFLKGFTKPPRFLGHSSILLAVSIFCIGLTISAIIKYNFISKDSMIDEIFMFMPPFETKYWTVWMFWVLIRLIPAGIIGDIYSIFFKWSSGGIHESFMYLIPYLLYHLVLLVIGSMMLFNIISLILYGFISTFAYAFVQGLFTEA